MDRLARAPSRFDGNPANAEAFPSRQEVAFAETATSDPAGGATVGQVVVVETLMLPREGWWKKDASILGIPSASREASAVSRRVIPHALLVQDIQ